MHHDPARRLVVRTSIPCGSRRSRSRPDAPCSSSCSPSLQARAAVAARETPPVEDRAALRRKPVERAPAEWVRAQAAHCRSRPAEAREPRRRAERLPNHAICRVIAATACATRWRRRRSSEAVMPGAPSTRIVRPGAASRTAARRRDSAPTPSGVPAGPKAPGAAPCSLRAAPLSSASGVTRRARSSSVGRAARKIPIVRRAVVLPSG
jgi:hypothetical protein